MDTPEVGAAVQYRDAAGDIYEAQVVGQQKRPDGTLEGIHLTVGRAKLYGVSKSKDGSPGWF